VCTIDPAPRLADALGISNLGAEPQCIAATTAHALGIDGESRLFAMRVDTERAFANLVNNSRLDPAIRSRILGNSLYRHITTDLTGSQEYAATLALYDLRTKGEFDLIILDTPPTSNALDFLETPERLTRAISSPAIRWFSRPDPTQSRFSLNRLGSGGAIVLRRAGKLLGNQFLDDLGTFLLDARQVLDGLLDRAHAVQGVLQQPSVGFLLVLTAEVAAVNEALDFADRLKQGGHMLCGFIVNRLLHPISPSPTAHLLKALIRLPELALWPKEDCTQAAHALSSLSDYLSRISVAQQNELARLYTRAGTIPITTVPLLPHDVSNLDSLKAVADKLERA
jgi:anion-transporting  ArsA/GET3 family ATPase